MTNPTAGSSALRARAARAGFAVLALAVFGAAAARQTYAQTQSVTLQFSDPAYVNPCTGEVLSINGTTTITTETTVGTDGRLHFVYHVVTKGEGVVVQSPSTPSTVGTKYIYSDMHENEINGLTPPFEITDVYDTRVIGPGPNNNFLFHFNVHITVDANGTLSASQDNPVLKCQ